MDFINSTSEVEKAKTVCNETLKSLNMERYEMIKNSEYAWVERDENRTVDEVVRLVEQHFSLKK